MQAIRNAGSYMYDGYKYVMSEAWQLGADATNEAYNIGAELYKNTSDIAYSLATDSYTEITPGDMSKNKTADVDQDQDRKNKVPLTVFSVDNYPNKISPSLLTQNEFEIQNKVHSRLTEIALNDQAVASSV